MLRLAEFFPIREADYGTPGPHEMLDLALDAVEGHDGRWFDLYLDLQEWIVDRLNGTRGQVDAIDPINVNSEWRRDAHNQLNNAIAWADQGYHGQQGKTYMDNLESVLRARANRHDDRED